MMVCHTYGDEFLKINPNKSFFKQYKGAKNK